MVNAKTKSVEPVGEETGYTTPGGIWCHRFSILAGEAPIGVDDEHITNFGYVVDLDSLTHRAIVVGLVLWPLTLALAAQVPGRFSDPVDFDQIRRC